jgi:hypothetical protein
MTANELLELPTTAQPIQAGEERLREDSSIPDILAHRVFNDFG